MSVLNSANGSCMYFCVSNNEWNKRIRFRQRVMKWKVVSGFVTGSLCLAALKHPSTTPQALLNDR